MTSLLRVGLKTLYYWLTLGQICTSLLSFSGFGTASEIAKVARMDDPAPRVAQKAEDVTRYASALGLSAAITDIVLMSQGCWKAVGLTLSCRAVVAWLDIALRGQDGPLANAKKAGLGPLIVIIPAGLFWMI